MKLQHLTLLLLMGLFLVSCNKDREDPEITITSPANNTEISAGDSFAFQVEVTDNEGLDLITFTDGSGIDESITTFDDPMSHKLNYNITTNQDFPAGELIMTVEATDLEGNVAKEDVTIIVN